MKPDHGDVPTDPQRRHRVEHDVSFVTTVNKHMLALHKGRGNAGGTPETVLADRGVIDACLCRAR